MNATGEELFARFLGGDIEAFEELVALYENGLSAFIYGFVRDQHEAKHLAIEAFAKLALSEKKFEGRSSIKTYLYTIGKNLALRSMNMRKRDQHLPFEGAVETLAHNGETPYELVAREETRRQLHAVMKELKEEYRAVLVLLYFEDMSYAEAGRAMNKSPKQISDLAYRAKAALKKRLENEQSSLAPVTEEQQRPPLRLLTNSSETSARSTKVRR